MSAAISSRPRATMRLQLHKDFTFSDAAELVPYLVDLGVSHVYASPILTARAGSMHGYDVVDPTAVNPELGGETGLRDFVAVLRSAGLGLIIDIVPNHMAVGGSDNPWWNDLLRHGRASRYAKFFDVNWDCEDADLRGKVLAPFLGKTYGEALADGDIRLSQTPSGEPIIQYFDNVFPIDPTDYAHVTECGLESFDPANPSGQALIHALLERQHFRLAWWGTAGDEINWRRFFDINGLAGLRIEVPEVFEATHVTLFRLYAEGLIDGFRVDHVDGLSDPPGYCRRLRQRLDELDPQRPSNVPHGSAYLVVEKILGVGETLPADWGVDGTSGYDFMNEISALQHDQDSETRLSKLWHEASGRAADFEPEEDLARQEILQRSFDAPLRAVTMALHRVARSDLATRDVSAPAIRRGLISLLSHFPVYRGYNEGGQRSAVDQAAFAKALAAAKRSSPKSAHAVLDHLDRWLGGEAADQQTLAARKVAATLFHQLSAPVAAKAVEDTAFYRYGRLLSRNDVGFDAARLGCSIAAFHRACTERLAMFPDAMLATATHDHKRGEDVRARLAVLSEMPDAWASFVTAARSLPATARPDPGDEIMLYQMIVGAWPLALDPTNQTDRQAFADRLSGWQEKALREAKLRTDWTSPDMAYEDTARRFLHELLSGQGDFLPLVQSFVERIASAGAVNGLAQAALKMTVPGMPDFFQGTEFWDFSLVDPDNRRPVDYRSRKAALDDSGDICRLLATWRDGRVKQSMIQKVLAFRRDRPSLFARGEYLPLSINGALASRMVAFARIDGHDAMIVVAPRWTHALLQLSDEVRFDPSRLENNIVVFPEQILGYQLRSVLVAGETMQARAEVSLNDLINDFPVAVLQSVKTA
ncbi:malto-oligosyltrehalose synthase [Rhodopila sp.]|uniref:malto-oligosyltrehalose synthase n=1 Tax=Rhodopila sp. TaxID=2480087 RepID=UPI003D0F7482